MVDLNATTAFSDIPTLAFRHPLVGAPGVGFHGGPAILSPVHRMLRHTRYHEPCDWFDGAETATTRLPGEFTYIGPAYHHFGHVMAEMVHRILPSLPSPARRWLMIATDGDTALRTAAELPVFMQDVLRLFAIDPDSVTILNRDCRVEHLHVAQQGSDFGGGPYPDYLDRLASFGERLPATSSPYPRWVYVSRSALPGGGGFLGERVVEHALQAAGVTIARPETMPLRDQMQLYRGADIVIFPEGSACHGVELLGPRSFGTAILLARRRDHMDIFGRVLRPRSERYAVIAPSPGTGPVFRKLAHITIGPMDHRALFALLHEHGLPRIIAVDEAVYQAQCLDDLRSFIDFHHTQRTDEIDPMLLGAVHEALAAQ